MKIEYIIIILAISVSTSNAQSLRDQLQDQWVIDQALRTQERDTRQRDAVPVIQYVNGVPQMPEIHPADLEWLNWDLAALQAYGDAIDTYNAKLKDEALARYKSEEIDEYNTRVVAYNNRVLAENEKRANVITETKRFQERVKEAQAQAVDTWPDLGISGSALNKRFIKDAKKLSIENPEFFRDSNWPLILATQSTAEIREGAEIAEFTASVNKFNAMTKRAFPDVDRIDSTIAKKMNEIADAMERDKDERVYAADASWIISNMAAKELGIAPSK